ncbi:interferon gamma [Molossus nigricans]
MNYTRYILAFQLCVILGSSCYCQFTISSEIEKLRNYFNASRTDIGDNGTLFLDILKNWKGENDIKIIQSQIVSFYFKLFENFKGNENIQSSMEMIKEELRVNFFNSSNDKLEDFNKLIQISVNDQSVQRRAIFELNQVIPVLSQKPSSRKRKRSQNVFRGWRASK